MSTTFAGLDAAPTFVSWAPGFGHSTLRRRLMSHAINPPSCGKKGGGHKNVCVSKTLRRVSQRKLARKQNIGISTRKPLSMDKV